MKKVGQLMKEMGFNPNGSDSAKEAFLKYLIKQSTGASVETPFEKKIVQDNPAKFLKFPAQLEFDFIDGDFESRKKA